VRNLSLPILALLALATLATGITAQFGWTWAAMTVGALTWVDLFALGRDQARAASKVQAEP
jgi:hypothetical protein